MIKKSVLFIVEGDDAERELVEKIYKYNGDKSDYEVYSYSTNIHVLSHKIIVDNRVDDSLDIRLALREDETDPDKRSILSQSYTDIFLVFDLDPQDDNFQFDMIAVMLDYFNDSTTVGKMYINYPMIESFRHLLKMPDDKFRDRYVEKEDCINYKTIVGDESAYTETKRYDHKFFISVATHHIKKSNFIRTGKYELPTIDEFEAWTEKDVFEKQLDLLQKKYYIYVVNEFVTYLAYRNPKLFFDQITHHKDMYDI